MGDDTSGRTDLWLDAIMVTAATFLGIAAVVERSWIQLALTGLVLVIYVPKVVRAVRARRV